MKQFYKTLYVNDFIYGYLDNINHEELEKTCIENYKKRLNENRWHTRYEDIAIPFSEEITKIIDQMSLAYSNKFNKSLILKDEPINFWAQVHYKNESTQSHNHLNVDYPKNSPDVSGVYYIKVPKNSGDLVLKYKKHKLDFSSIVFNPEERKFIIFQSGLDHYVTPNLNEEPRIIISFNFKII
jgi:hypothetical protein|tara:strand:+ start:1742 stop:2290 length:549 start_codon:yes stop_codon:yes gene_type:complete